MTDQANKKETQALSSSPSLQEGLIETLNARIAEYQRVMTECRAELSDADRDNAAVGTITSFADDPCPTCEDTATLIPLLQAAAQSLQDAATREAQLRALVEKWRNRTDHGFDPEEDDGSVAFWNGARGVIDEVAAILNKRGR